MKLLFVCTQNLQRSPTAEEVFSRQDYETKSAGISPFSEKQITEQAIDWADKVIVMEEIHKDFILKNFPNSSEDKIIVLGIPDRFYRNDSELIGLLKEMMKEKGFKF